METALELAALVHRAQATPRELLTAALERAERVNGRLNAIVRLEPERALAGADAVHPAAPLAGVPILLKDLLAEWAGVPLTEGSAYLREHVSPFDSELVRRYRAAGLVPIGKTNVPEFGIVATTEPQLFGPARNPWDPERITGGSSGGSAAAVAARIVAVAHANDGGGSIRIPAALCGVFGLKPSRGRVAVAPRYGDVFSGLVSEHAVTLSVRDSAALLDAVAGPAPGDPYAAPPQARPYLDECDREPGSLRVGCAPGLVEGETAKLLRDLGHQVEAGSPNVDLRETGRAFTTVWTAGVAWTIRHWERVTGRPPTEEFFEPLTWELYRRGQAIAAAEYLLAVQDLQAAGREVAAFFNDRDAWLTPATVGPTPLLGFFDSPPDDVTGPLRKMGRFAPDTWLANVTGCPAMSVPLEWDEDRLPLGSHFMSAMGDEAVLFRLAAQLEAVQPWAQRVPPVNAEAVVR